MGELGADVTYTVRQLLRSPGFAAVLSITLALGIGAQTAVFSVVHGVLLRAPPFPGADRLQVVWMQFPVSELRAE